MFDKASIPWVVIGIIGILVCAIIGYLYYQKTQYDDRFAYLYTELGRLQRFAGFNPDPPSAHATSLSSCPAPVNDTEDVMMPPSLSEETCGNDPQDACIRKILHSIDQNDAVPSEIDPMEEDEEDLSFDASMDELSEVDLISHMSERASRVSHASHASRLGSSRSHGSHDSQELSQQILQMNDRMKRDLESISMISDKMIRSEDHRKRVLESLNTKRSELDALHTVSQQDVNSELKRLIDNGSQGGHKVKLSQVTVSRGNGNGNDSTTVSLSGDATANKKYKLKYLKDLCVKHGLPTVGKKEKLIEMLQARNLLHGE